MTLDKKIRDAIKVLILEVDPTAKVFAFNNLSHEPGDWANLFKKGGKVNGWVIRRNGSDDDRSDKSRTVSDIYVYDVWGFYNFHGASRTGNSDDEFQAIIDRLKKKIRSEPQLRVVCDEADEDCVDEHQLLKFPPGNITTLDGGSEQMHFAEGTLKVVLCERVY